jgi:fructokinase
LILNYQEACTLMKKNLKPLLLGKELKNISKVKILVITLGDKGSLTFYENKIFEADVFKPKKFVDTTGAGDAFSSAFFANLFLNKFVLNEEIVRKSIIWGSANASSNIEQLGAQIGLLKKEDFFKYQSLRLKIKSWQY